MRSGENDLYIRDGREKGADHFKAEGILPLGL